MREIAAIVAFLILPAGWLLFHLVAGWQGWRRHQEREGRTGDGLKYNPDTDEFERY